MEARDKKNRRRQKYKPLIQEDPPNSEAIHGRGASWSPANRFEKLHVDVNDVDVVDVDLDDEERPRRETEFFRDGSKTIITRNNSPDVGFETSVNPYRGCEHGYVIVTRGRLTNISAFPPDSISKARLW